MKRIAVFCIPAHGHTNPMLPVVRALVRRGDAVRFYSFEPFREKIQATGAEYIACDRFMGKLTEREEAGLKKVSPTEMSVQDIRLTLAMNDFLHEEFMAFRPDVVYSDSVCFWGKLNAWKHDVPLVVSTSTFAFNQLSSQYMKNSPREIAGLMLGLPRVSRELNKLKAYGYKFKGLFSLIQTDNDTDAVVYTSRDFQPYSESFSKHVLFAGPSILTDRLPDKRADRPLVYIALGTVINDRPDFYRRCIDALKDEAVEVCISCGSAVDIASLGPLPENVKVYPSVDQPEVLSRAGAFITHCGMNSVSESMYMATPMVLYPQTNEQAAVARRVAETGAGVILKDDSVSGIREAVLRVLRSGDCARAAQARSEDFRRCPGPEGAADFIERAPHTAEGPDVMKQLNRANVRWQVIYNLVKILLGVLVFRFTGGAFRWIYVAAAILLSPFINKLAQRYQYKRLIEGMRRQGGSGNGA